MKASVIREMSSAEIRERIESEKTAYLKMKMNHVVSTLENPMKLKSARKAIARLATELTKREKEELSTEPSGNNKGAGTEQKRDDKLQKTKAVLENDKAVTGE